MTILKLQTTSNTRTKKRLHRLIRHSTIWLLSNMIQFRSTTFMIYVI